VQELCSFFRSHIYDPYSALVGLIAVPRVVDASIHIGDAEKVKILQTKHKDSEYKLLYEDLLVQVLEWSANQTQANAVRSLDEFCAIRRGIQSVPPVCTYID
jgi:hypothetical protein